MFLLHEYLTTFHTNPSKLSNSFPCIFCFRRPHEESQFVLNMYCTRNANNTCMTVVTFFSLKMMQSCNISFFNFAYLIFLLSFSSHFHRKWPMLIISKTLAYDSETFSHNVVWIFCGKSINTGRRTQLHNNNKSWDYKMENVDSTDGQFMLQLRWFPVLGLRYMLRLSNYAGTGYCDGKPYALRLLFMICLYSFQ